MLYFSVIGKWPFLCCGLSWALLQTITPVQAGPRDFVGYYPSWLDTEAAPLAAVSPRYSNVIVAFARPDFSWNGRNWSGTGLQFSASPKALRAEIAALHANGQRVLLAVGGATYGQWGPLARERDKPGAITAALKHFVADMGFDGIDVDYERDGTSPQIITEYRAAIAVLREASRGKLLSLAAWSTGADCTAQSSRAPCGGKISEASGSAGRERLVFSDSATVGKIDLINVMSYDAGVTQYDPVTGWALYRDIFPSRVTVNIGFEIAPEGWGGATLVKDDSAATCESAMIVADQFGSLIHKPYSVERMLHDGPLTPHANSNARDGAMLWHIAKNQARQRCASSATASPRAVEDTAQALLGR